ncbi:CRISPR-associated RAMP protein Csx7 [Polyangium sp. 15x6]|uniref:type III CRISPR-associated RAMP protein Csx7 n=1 Tax=Polyangium sp. 15x6 TaxID=3042687 RepID=UPI00249C928F|nr:CRISPR-associated RAMP protein Csx7 [Polyangium sp. 15x6]MDI3290987.1 CRISPR-associated RAMP protein Csx7 [Polyangium sp. 15x6]
MTSSVADFHKLKQRLRLSGQIVTRTGLRIGSGGSGELDGADLPVLRDAQGYPFIPGASLKGSLRSTIEALVRGAELPRDTGLWACDPLLESYEGGACGHHAPGKRGEVDPEQHCAVCRLFGSRIVASHVRFSDALMRLPESDVIGRVPVEVRDGVAIDRDLRTVYGGQKYDFEVVSPGTCFDLEVFIENPKDWLMGLLIMGFDQIRDGFTALGGFTSRGLGRVDIVWSGAIEVSARDLLEGKPEKRLPSGDLEPRFSTFREALAARTQRRA